MKLPKTCCCSACITSDCVPESTFDMNPHHRVQDICSQTDPSTVHTHAVTSPTADEGTPPTIYGLENNRSSKNSTSVRAAIPVSEIVSWIRFWNTDSNTHDRLPRSK